MLNKSPIFLNMGFDFLAAGRAASGDMRREDVYLYILFPTLRYWSFLVCFQTVCWVQAKPLSHIPLQDLAAGWLRIAKC